MKHIFISAGHSDTAPGATYGGLKEAVLMTELRDLVAFYLDKHAVAYSMDGKKGENKSLSEAVKLIPKGAVAVEFHLNALSATSTGVETLSAPKDYDLGNALCTVVSDVLGIRNRGAKPENSGQHKTLAFVQAGGLILEVFFLSNPTDVAKYEDKKWVLAREIARLLVEEASK